MEPAIWWAGVTFVLRQVSRDADVSHVPPFQQWSACPTLPVVLWLAGCGFRFRQVAMNLPDADVRVGWDKRTIERTGKQPRTSFFQRPADLRETERTAHQNPRSICEPAHPISPPFLCDARSSKWSPLSGGPALALCYAKSRAMLTCLAFHHSTAMVRLSHPTRCVVAGRLWIPVPAGGDESPRRGRSCRVGQADD